MRAGRTSRRKALGRLQTQSAKLRSEGIEGGARESGEGDGRGDVQQLGAAGGGFQAAGQEKREILSGEQGRRSEEHTSELQSLRHLVCRLLLEKKKQRANRRGGDSGSPQAGGCPGASQAR